MESRRSANYESSIWDDHYIRSLKSSYTWEKHADEAEKLKNEVKIIIDETTNELKQLELIDNLRRLGICNHFQDRISNMLHIIYEEEENPNYHEYMEKDLHLTTLKFRLLRQQGYRVPQDVFSCFLDKEGDFQVGLGEDVRGLLSLYEASYLSMEGENILDLAQEFSTRLLKERLEQMEEDVGEQVKHALELPLHWRMQRLEARWFIQVYERRSDANLNLVKLAKLNFNMLQAIYQDDLKRVSRWYEESGLVGKLSFARHRLAECFLWSMGFTPEAHHGYAREMMTKVAVLLTITDDVYDLYGTLEELQVLTEIIGRWDVNLLDRLPEYMQICFLAEFNSTNELAYNILRDHGMNVISDMRRLWAELSQCWYREANWFHGGYVPTTDEYLNTAYITITGPLLLYYGYFTTANPINKQELQRLEQNVRWPSMIFRLADDLETSSDEIKRGDVPKSIQCFMKETGCCEEEGRKRVKKLIEEAWKRMNKDILMEKPFNEFGSISMNLGRMALCFYQHGDGFGVPHLQTKTNLVSLLVQPIQIP